MEERITQLIEHRRDKLLYYFPYNFLKESNYKEQINFLLEKKWHPFEVLELSVNEEIFVFFFERLEWDSSYFKIPCYKLLTILFEKNIHFNNLQQSIILFQEYLKKNAKNFYLFAEIPTEDNILIQSMTFASFRLIETRLHYYKNLKEEFQNERYPVAQALIEHIEILRKTASLSRNLYDRIHSDVFFTTQEGDSYLETYIENCIKGFADFVLIPDHPKPEAFMAIKKEYFSIENIKSYHFARVLLTAVAPSFKGWHYKLVCETLQYAQENQMTGVLMTTQASNKAVIHNNERLGFKYTGLSHILSYHPLI